LQCYRWRQENGFALFHDEDNNGELTNPVPHVDDGHDFSGTPRDYRVYRSRPGG
jgi:hypothetical protein